MASEVKICGITRVQDARDAALLGADYIGLNFFRGSPRYLRPDQARSIADAVRSRTRIVGVFVDADPERIEKIMHSVGLELLQFHGNEPPEAIATYGERAIKVLKIGSGAPDPEVIARYATVGGFLFDTAHPDLHGGTGAGWPFELVAGIGASKKVLIAGGLEQGNVKRALQLSGARGVDVCSGVELSQGVKDRELMRRLIEQVKS